MIAINKNDHVLDRRYADILVRSYPLDPRDEPSEHFIQDGIFVPAEEARLICLAFDKKPLECDSEEEIAAIKGAVCQLKRITGELGRSK